MEFLDDDMRSGQALEAVPRYKPRLIVASLNVFFELFDGSVPSRFNGVSSSLVSIVVVAPLVAVGLLLSGAAMRTGEVSALPEASRQQRHASMTMAAADGDSPYPYMMEVVAMGGLEMNGMSLWPTDRFGETADGRSGGCNGY